MMRIPRRLASLVANTVMNTSSQKRAAKATTPPPKESKPTPPPPLSDKEPSPSSPTSELAGKGVEVGEAAPLPKPKPKKRPLKKSKSSISRPQKGEDGWDSAQEELELQMEILREQERGKMTKRRRVFKEAPEPAAITVPAYVAPKKEENEPAPVEMQTKTTTAPPPEGRYRDPFHGQENPYT